jgi:hypothetical protein
MGGVRGEMIDVRSFGRSVKEKLKEDDDVEIAEVELVFKVTIKHQVSL